MTNETNMYTVWTGGTVDDVKYLIAVADRCGKRQEVVVKGYEFGDVDTVKRVERVLDARLPRNWPGEGKRRRRGEPSRKVRRAFRRLEARQRAFDELPQQLQHGRTRPGSMSGRK